MNAVPLIRHNVNVSVSSIVTRFYADPNDHREFTVPFVASLNLPSS